MNLWLLYTEEGEVLEKILKDLSDVKWSFLIILHLIISISDTIKPKSPSFLLREYLKVC